MLLVWPKQGGDWGNHLTAARATLERAAYSIALHQPLLLVAPDREALDDIHARESLSRLSRLQVMQVNADDIWARDFGPLTLFVGAQRHFVDCRFNGWKKKYPAQLDDRVTAALCAKQSLGEGRYRRREYVLEGGAVDSNGAGCLLTTRRCLIHNARNKGDTERKWNMVFREEFGILRVHWLDHGYLEGDDTDGHVDTIARFVGPDAICYQGCDDRSDPQFEDFANLEQQLAQLRDLNNRPYTLHRLPMPRAQLDEDGRRLPAGYANFLIANRVVLVPQYLDPTPDAHARRVLASIFPDREILGIDCRPLIQQNGAIHCAAMHIPALPDPEATS